MTQIAILITMSAATGFRDVLTGSTRWKLKKGWNLEMNKADHERLIYTVDYLLICTSLSLHDCVCFLSMKFCCTCAHGIQGNWKMSRRGKYYSIHPNILELFITILPISGDH